jgi:hypothetical protein
MPTLPFTPKLRRFGLAQNGVVLAHFLALFFFFFFLREKKKKKGNGATPLPKNGVARPPPFWPRGGFGHPIRPVWGGRSHPQAFGGGPATPKATKKKKKKNEMGLCRWGWPWTTATPKGLGWLRPPPTTQTHLRVVRPPPTAQTHFFFFSWWLPGWPDHPQRPGGGRSHPLGKKGWSGHPNFGQGGGSSHPRFPFFFFFSFSFLFF